MRRPSSPLPIRPLATVLVILLLLTIPGTLLANGGTLRLANVPMGDYLVSVFTDPTPVRPDSLDVSVLIFEQGVEGVPDGVVVTVRTELLELHGDTEDWPDARAGMGAMLQATREQADDRRYYATKFALGAPGRWSISVEVDGEGGQGEASFEVTARERGLLGHPLAITLLALLPLGLAAWWILRQEEGVESEGDAGSRRPGVGSVSPVGDPEAP